VQRVVKSIEVTVDLLCAGEIDSDPVVSWIERREFSVTLRRLEPLREFTIETNNR
jgi:hypothetical protein